MKFKSTRGTEVNSFSEAFNQGLASDGGLFVPEYFPNISSKLDLYSTLSYPALVAEFMHLFSEEINKDEWAQIAEEAYSGFDAFDKVSIKELIDDSDTSDTRSDTRNNQPLSVLELFHGPTLAFKDFALQVVGKLYERECLKNKKTYTILGATSGDTGSAAIYSVLGNPAINIFIMYPEGKIAPEQELQITTTGAENVFPIAIKGTFDDAQSIVKEMFSDVEFSRKIGLAAVNSINIARILAQSAYYLFTYLRLRKEHTIGDGPLDKDLTAKKIRFIVPTGNFGNVLSGWFLNNMGLDCEFILATNENDVLHTLWQTGEYKKKAARETYAPSMDIQQASNFERLLYFMYDKDCAKVNELLGELKTKGVVHIDKSLFPQEITSVATSNKQIEENIKECYEKYSYILDPHTACAYSAIKGADSNTSDISDSLYHNVIVSTASPAKFPEIIEKSIGIIPSHARLEALKNKEKTYVKMNPDIGEVKKYISMVLGI